MKIASLDVIALEKEKGCGSRPVIVRINTDEGIYGYGEAAIAIGCGSTAAYELLKDMGPMIIGMDAMAHEVIWEKLYKQSFWAQGNGAVFFSAISAIDIALWDIKGKALGVPVYQLLGGKQRDRLRAYASQLQFGWGTDEFNPGASRGDVDFYREACQKAMDQGYDAVKINFLRFDRDGKMLSYLDTTGHLSRQAMHTAEERIAAVRETVGPDVDIIIENHAMTDANTAVQFARMASRYDIMFLEEGAPR